MDAPTDLPNNFSLIVFAKVPGGAVKTRIAATVGREMADRIYLELLGMTANQLSALPHHLAFAGSDAGILPNLFPRATSIFPQEGGELGTRLMNSCLHLANSGGQRFCTIGCDCPELCRQDILEAATALDRGSDVVLGPAEDGGYYLAAVTMKGLRIFEATRWGTPELFGETLEIAKSHGLNVSLLPRRSDVDTFEDYQRWKSGRHG